jgi:hypothetical protein
LLKAMFQYRPIAVRKQEQHYFSCSCLGFEFICLPRCGVFQLFAVSFRAWFVVMDVCFVTRDNWLQQVLSFLAVPLQETLRYL